MVATTLTQFADSSSGLGSLGIDGKAFVIQLITFVLAFLVLRRYAFKPILKVLSQRRETIENGVKLGEQMRQEKAALEHKVSEALHKARQEADTIISGAQDSARQVIREAEDKARDKAAGILKDADSQIDQNTARARKQLEKELVGLVSDATEAIIQEKVDAKKDASLIERALKDRIAA
jgi:F-type H+-transporting ATPase subunit b